ncbi:MAG: TlpA family protein disulfide reductase [Actinobacteria bacterium]|nr:TlpA family protein disulfide reductase [Actinomycetota bacterium]
MVPRTRRLLAFACLALLVGSACGGGEGSIFGVTQMDKALPRLVGETLDGQRLDVSAYAAGSVLVLNVWSYNCAPCRKEQPMLVELAGRYEGEGVRFLGINHQDDRDAARGWIREFEVPYPSLFDPSGGFAADLGFPALPDTYVVDRQGTIRWVVFGETDERELSGLIDDVLA